MISSKILWQLKVLSVICLINVNTLNAHVVHQKHENYAFDFNLPIDLFTSEKLCDDGCLQRARESLQHAIEHFLTEINLDIYIEHVLVLTPTVQGRTLKFSLKFEWISDQEPPRIDGSIFHQIHEFLPHHHVRHDNGAGRCGSQGLTHSLISSSRQAQYHRHSHSVVLELKWRPNYADVDSRDYRHLRHLFIAAVRTILLRKRLLDDLYSVHVTSVQSHSQDSILVHYVILLRHDLPSETGNSDNIIEHELPNYLDWFNESLEHDHHHNASTTSNSFSEVIQIKWHHDYSNNDSESYYNIKCSFHMFIRHLLKEANLHVVDHVHIDDFKQEREHVRATFSVYWKLTVSSDEIEKFRTELSTHSADFTFVHQNVKLRDQLVPHTDRHITAHTINIPLDWTSAISDTDSKNLENILYTVSAAVRTILRKHQVLNEVQRFIIKLVLFTDGNAELKYKIFWKDAATTNAEHIQDIIRKELDDYKTLLDETDFEQHSHRPQTHTEHSHIPHLTHEKQHPAPGDQEQPKKQYHQPHEQHQHQLTQFHPEDTHRNESDGPHRPQPQHHLTQGEHTHFPKTSNKSHPQHERPQQPDHKKEETHSDVKVSHETKQDKDSNTVSQVLVIEGTKHVDTIKEHKEEIEEKINKNVQKEIESKDVVDTSKVKDSHISHVKTNGTHTLVHIDTKVQNVKESDKSHVEQAVAKSAETKEVKEHIVKKTGETKEIVSADGLCSRCPTSGTTKSTSTIVLLGAKFFSGVDRSLLTSFLLSEMKTELKKFSVREAILSFEVTQVMDIGSGVGIICDYVVESSEEKGAVRAFQGVALSAKVLEFLNNSVKAS
ncbi:unnamed protein product [Didymodactylos carnosus]|uniref:SEA domain-containing protein n=1 Tax=Didymodactylos carnosus TaxID=1234261 RepID=A0A813VJI8_9BILA|nr:unnamed protein product [Didymodactylos carnosus]